MDSELCNTRAKPDFSVKLMKSVDETLTNFLSTKTNFNFISPIQNIHIQKQESGSTMKSETVFFSETNSDLWDKALQTALGDITVYYYPHYLVVQKLINYTLNGKNIPFGMVSNFFSKLLLFHPPNLGQMQSYYWSILNDKYIKFNNVLSEEENLFWFLIEAMLCCLEDEDCFKEFEQYSSKSAAYENEKEISLLNLSNRDWRNSLNVKSPGKRDPVYFESFSSGDKFRRVLVLLTFVCDILESNFTSRLGGNAHQTAKENRTFLSLLLWPNFADVGSVNTAARKLIHIFKLLEVPDFCSTRQIHRRLLTLLADLTRESDATVSSEYPFLGKNSLALARELSMNYIDGLSSGYKMETLAPIQMMKPHWLRMLVCCNLCSHLTGILCPPNLVNVNDVLKSVLEILLRQTTSEKRRNLRINTRSKKGLDILKNISFETRYCSGGCKLKKNKRPKISQCAETNESGWSVLHEAILKDHEDCVEDILNEASRRDGGEAVNTRLKGFQNFTPLMCAVVKDNQKICRLLLEHSGSELLLDRNVKGETPMDLCRSSNVANLLKLFTCTGSSLFKFKKSVSPTEAELVVVLCIWAVESYFVTYRTLDVCKCLKNSAITDGEVHDENLSPRFDYRRYDVDITENVPGLIVLLDSFTGLKEIKDVTDPLLQFLKHHWN